MTKPEVMLENYQQIYDYYGSRRPNVYANKILHTFLGAIIRPQITFDLGAKEELSRLLETQTTLILASNHTSNFDPPTIAAMAQREKIMRPMRGNTSVMSKQSLFKWPLRSIIDQLYAIPTFRTGDVERSDGTVDAERTTLQRAASQEVQDMSVRLLDSGIHMAIFPEGTRNKNDPSEVQPLKRGLGDIACRVSSETALAIVPVGIHYTSEDTRTNFTPAVHLGAPVHGPFDDASHVTALMQHELQTAVDTASTWHRG